MILRTVLIILAAIASALAQPVQPGDLLKEAVASADHRISYGPGALHFGELRLPKSASLHPLLILVHGGCWADRLPNLDPRATSFELLRPMATALADMGIATWNVEYSRVGNAGGGWPGTFHDLSRAVDYVRTLAKTYPIDLSKVAVAGHSSGGQLALWIAARPKLNRSSELNGEDATNKEGPLRVRAAIDLDGPPDLATSQPLERRMCPVAAITDFMGGSPEQFASRYAEASPTPFLPLGVRQELIGGSLFGAIREQVAAYETAARSKGDSITVTELAGSGHFDMLSPHSPYWKTVSDRIAAALR
jgi:acetyl esterase/lipase